MSDSVPTRWRRPGLFVVVGVLAAAAIGIGVCETLGWPFLAEPAQRWLASTLDRRVSLSSDPAARVKIGLIGDVRIVATHLEIGAPHWSAAPFMLRAQDADLRLGYLDLWRASRGAPLRISALRATALDIHLERRSDGRASWEFGTPAEAQTKPPASVPEFGRLEVGAGTLQLRDAALELDFDARFSLNDGSVPGAVAAPSASAPLSSSGGSATTSTPLPPGLEFHASGQYRKRPLKIDLSSVGVLTAVGAGAARLALPVTLNARTDRVQLTFKGTVTDVLRLRHLQGRVRIKGQSLAALGDPLGVTLPTTGPFDLDGRLVKRGALWSTVIDRATVGSSQLNAALTFDADRPVPLLAGRLVGSNLLLADLGPAIGTPAPGSPRSHDGRALPDRSLDIPSLRAMDANVMVAIDSVDLGSTLLQPLRPLHTHLVLANGVLTLRDIDARTSQGRLVGTVRLDGREAQAVWNADLRWSGVRLEQWIHQARSNGAPSYVTGSLSGRARVEGRGRSTAAILGSLAGGVHMDLAGGTISHLMVEAAGLDLAQSLGVMISGDDALPILCTVADLVASKGVLRPRVMVLDTPDSTLWIDGSLSLASEALDLHVIVMPKDFSLLALRSPIRVRGTLAAPIVSVQKGALGARVGAAALLALINPLAAVIPLIDTGASAEAGRAAADCRALAVRAKRATPITSDSKRSESSPADAAERARLASPPGTGPQR
ncbi:MAG: AsmA family protein [Burkholderiaceae bacterium]